MRIQDALSRIETIQMQLDRTERRCCYRWATVATSGLLAAIAAVAQYLYLPDPVFDLQEYLFLWISVAAASVMVIAAEIALHWQQTHSPHLGRQTLVAVRQFAPCVAVGALVTWAIATTAPEHAAILPGLWATFFSLGIFASAAHLPVGGVAVGAYYLLSGLVCIVWGQGDQALQPWTMLITFAVGQSISALVLFHGHIRREDQDD
jgi:hypothetical protein